jgi:hypothetical protein
LFEGKGFQVDDDLFTAAGRANWCLRGMTGRNFGTVRPVSIIEQLNDLQAKWQRFLDDGTGDDVPEAFPSENGSLSEIRSLEALEALIVSLQPSEQKDRYTTERLKQIYGLDALPDDPQSPAQLCNPDSYTYHYLATITTVAESNTPAWWTDWWNENHDRLEWDADTAKFVIK